MSRRRRYPQDEVIVITADEFRAAAYAADPVVPDDSPEPCSCPEALDLRARLAASEHARGEAEKHAVALATDLGRSLYQRAKLRILLERVRRGCSVDDGSVVAAAIDEALR